LRAGPWGLETAETWDARRADSRVDWSELATAAMSVGPWVDERVCLKVDEKVDPKVAKLAASLGARSAVEWAACWVACWVVGSDER